MFRAIICFIIAATFISAIPTLVHAQTGRVKTLCPEAALNISLYEKVLAQKVKQMINTETFKEIRVRVSMRRVGGETGIRTNSFDEVLNGLSLSAQSLTVLASGALAYDFRCTHIYVARIRVTATDKETGVRFSSSNDSRITINSAGEAAVQRVR